MQDNHPWLKHLETLHQQTIDLSLERIRQTGEKAALFDMGCKVVLVAGTNGKGTTIHALETLLSQAGLSIGTYTSPHIVTFNERIKINGKFVSDEALIEAFEVIETLRGNIPLTFFEFTTLAAFYLFKKHSIDVLLAEIGLGGRFDAVNCLTPDLSIITSIGYDHQSWLGNTLEDIAREKAGILRKNTPCIIGKDANISSLMECVQALDLEDICVAGGVDFDWLDLSKPLGETHDVWSFNAQQVTVPSHNLPSNSVSLALAAYQHLSTILTLPPIEMAAKQLNQASMMGRFYTLSESPQIIVDVAHNIDSCRLLKERLLRHPCNGRRLAVWAMLNDKDASHTVRLFHDVFDEWYVPDLAVERAYTQHELVELLCREGVSKVFAVNSTKLTYEAVIKNMDANDQMIVFGSFYTVSKFINNFCKDQITTSILESAPKQSVNGSLSVGK